jgi:sRNA-binding protein
MGTWLRRGRTNRAFTPSGFAKIFSDNSGVPSRHWPAREKWPLAFPERDARPLALGTVGQVAEAMGWSIPYTIGVLTYWKMAPFYCQAVLSHDQRITLDGAPAEPVDTEAKELAAKQLAKLAARNAAKKPAQCPPKAKPKSKPAPPTGGSAQLRDRVRAGLLRRSV